jgi:hypothetical protein
MLVWCLPTKQTPSAATTNNQTQHMQPKKNLLLKIVLALTATFIVLSGLNIGLGGIPTLGWGGQKDFLTVTNETDYRIQDSHVRYVGGLWLGIGLFFFLSLTNLARFKTILLFCFVLIFFGGILRLFQGQPDTTFRLPVLPSLLAELLGMPFLFFWLQKVVGSRAD